MKRFMRVDEHGNEIEQVDKAYIDGYPVGERALEGVIFEITIAPNNTFKATVIPEHAEYFRTLNERKWLKEVESFCEDQDVFDSSPRSGTDDVVCVDPDAPPPAEPERYVGQAVPFAEIAQKFGLRAR